MCGIDECRRSHSASAFRTALLRSQHTCSNHVDSGLLTATDPIIELCQHWVHLIASRIVWHYERAVVCNDHGDV